MIAPKVASIYLADTIGVLAHRRQKLCVCVSAIAGKYLLINTEHRKMYDDFVLRAQDYGFFQGTDRFLACSALFAFDSSLLKQKMGKLTVADISMAAEKIRASRTIAPADKAVVLADLLGGLS